MRFGSTLADVKLRRGGVSGRKVIPVDILLLDLSIHTEAVTRTSFDELRDSGGE